MLNVLHVASVDETLATSHKQTASTGNDINTNLFWVGVAETEANWCRLLHGSLTPKGPKIKAKGRQQGWGSWGSGSLPIS